MKCPTMIVKMAGVEDRGNWFWNPELSKMRSDAKDGISPIDIKRYQKITLDEIKKYMDSEKAEHDSRKKRFNAGERETWKEYGSDILTSSGVGFLVGGPLGVAASFPARLLKIPFKKLRGKSLLTNMGVGGMAAGATIPPIIRALMGRRKIKDPGRYVPDEELSYMAKEFAIPYRKNKPHLLNDWIGVGSDIKKEMVE